MNTHRSHTKQWSGSATIASAAIFALAACQNAFATACEACAADLLEADENSAYADYWVERAMAEHFPTSAERAAAVAAAEAGIEEALSDNVDRFDARLELCLELNEGRYHPVIVPANFDGGRSNSFFPLTIGTIRTYEGLTVEGLETIVVTVTPDTRTILGIQCAVVRDIAYLDGEVIEDTLDYYATDDSGNVWYFGENTVEYENGLAVSTHGAWIAGEDGAKPGIVMKANPQVGAVYRQEFAPSEAEDAAEVIARNRRVATPAGTFTGCVKTEDFTPIEPDALEYRFYAPGIGVVREVNAETGEIVNLVEVSNN